MGAYSSKGDDASNVKSKKGWNASIPDYWNFIPVELSLHIFNFFDSNTLLRISCVNRVLNSLGSEERVWRSLYERDFSERWMDFFSDRNMETWSWKTLYRETRWLERRVNDKDGQATQKSIKLVVTGDNCGGQKTALLLAYFHNTCPTLLGYVPAVFDNNVVSLLVVSEKETYNVQLSLWDTSGQEEFERLRPLQYANTNIFLLCFSIVQPDSFESITHRWVPEISHHCPGIPVILVGLQKQLRSDSKTLRKLKSKGMSPVSFSQGVTLAEKLGIPYFECSAESGENIVPLFRTAVKNIIRSNPKSHGNKSLFGRSRSAENSDAMLISSGNRAKFLGKSPPVENSPPLPAFHGEDIYIPKNDSKEKKKKDIQVSQPFNLKRNTFYPNGTSLSDPEKSDTSGIYMSEAPTFLKLKRFTKEEKEKKREEKERKREMKERERAKRVTVSAPSNLKHVSSGEFLQQFLNPNSGKIPIKLPSPPAPKIRNFRESWEEYCTEDGHRYWYNKVSKESRWNLPEELPELPEPPSYGNASSPPPTFKLKKMQFGGTLSQYESVNHVSVPNVVMDTCHVIQSRGFRVDGIFQSLGNDENIQQLKQGYDRDENVDLSSVNIHDVVGLLKFWLRDLKEPVIPPDFKLKLYRTLDITEISARFQAIQKILEEMPPCNYSTLKALLYTFWKVHENSQKTQMTAEKMASGMKNFILGSRRKAAEILQNLIENYPSFFPTPDLGGDSDEISEDRLTKVSSFGSTSSESIEAKAISPKAPESSRDTSDVIERRYQVNPKTDMRRYSMPDIEAQLAAALSGNFSEKSSRRRTVSFLPESPPAVDGMTAGTYQFTLLVRVGKDDFPTKIQIGSDGIEDFQEKLRRKFRFDASSTVLYFDDDFNEYVRLPEDLSQLPAKAKLMIVNE